MAKSKYETHVLPKLFLVECWARDGLIDEQIAKNLGIAYSTFKEYKSRYPALADALKKGKEVIDYEVENALLKKCLGYYVPEKVAFKCKRVYYDDNDRRCEVETVEVAEVERYVPPDTTAQLAWLNNRKPKSWRRDSNREKLQEKRFEHEKEIDSKKYW